MKNRLLFVRRWGSDEGFSYAIDLAKSLKAGIALLTVESKLTKFEDVMAAVAFAEAGDLDTVKELLKTEEKSLKENLDASVQSLAAKCSENSIEFADFTASGNPLSAIKDFLEGHPAVEMVVLSPELLVNDKVLDLGKLLKNVTRPIVTMTRPAKVGA